MAKQRFTECPRQWFMRQHNPQVAAYAVLGAEQHQRAINTATIRHTVDLARLANRLAVFYRHTGDTATAENWRAKRDHYLRIARQLKADQPRTMEPKQ